MKIAFRRTSLHTTRNPGRTPAVADDSVIFDQRLPAFCARYQHLALRRARRHVRLFREFRRELLRNPVGEHVGEHQHVDVTVVIGLHVRGPILFESAADRRRLAGTTAHTSTEMPIAASNRAASGLVPRDAAKLAFSTRPTAASPTAAVPRMWPWFACDAVNGFKAATLRIPPGPMWAVQRTGKGGRGGGGRDADGDCTDDDCTDDGCAGS
jgi:hypothetical protein